MKINYLSALASLLPVVSETLSEISRLPAAALSPDDYKNYTAYKANVDKKVREITEKHRQKIFDTIFSVEFVGRYPVLKKVLKLPVSELNRSVIFLAGIGCTTQQISDILQSDRHSVSTMRSSNRKNIADIFRH